LPGSREEFERWLGGVLFPQRAKRIEERRKKEADEAEGVPYVHMNAPVVPNPPRMRPTRPAAPTVGIAGGSQFAARRQQQAKPQEATAAAAAAAAQHTKKPQGTWGAAREDDDWVPQSNVQTSLEPFSTAPEAPDARANVSEQAGAKPNPIGGLLQAIGNKAQQDIKTTMQAAGRLGQQPPAAPNPAYSPGAPIALLRCACLSASHFLR
jgi:hypothetical protein